MDDDDGFADYQETTVDPGPWFNVATAVFCGLSVVLLPFMVSIGRRYEKRRRLKVQSRDNASISELQVQQEQAGVSDASSQVSESSQGKETFCTAEVKSPHYSGPVQAVLDRVLIPPYPDDEGAEPTMKSSNDDDHRLVKLLDAGAGGTRNRQAGARRFRRGQKDELWQREQKEERRQSLTFHGQESELLIEQARSPPSAPSDEQTSYSRHPTKSREGAEITLYPIPDFPGRTPEQLRQRNTVEQTRDGNVSTCSPLSKGKAPDAVADEQDLQHNADVASVVDESLDVTCCGSKAWWKPSVIAAAFDKLLVIVEWDREMKRILKLSIPFSISAVVIGIFNVVRIALVANYISTEAVSAYTIVNLILNLTQEFFGGFVLSSASLCSQAYGRRNYKLAGEYVQITCILYTLCMIPTIIAWNFLMDDVVRLFGFNEEVAQMAQNYARYRVVGQWFEGLDESYGSLLEVIDHERFTMSLDIASELYSTSLILGACLARSRQGTLQDVGIIELTTDALFFGLALVISILVGWMKKYTEGLFRTNALRNSVAVRTVFRTAVPLALGQLLQYGEWEVLTIFVASLGVAEVTTWGIVGSVWDTLEALTEGFGDAGEIRVAYQLGSSRPAVAKLSSYKSIFVSVICATIVTAILWCIGEDLARLLTPDPTLQRLIIEVLPLLGMGNIALTAGTVSWACVGGSGRYRLATFVAFVSSWGVTLPLAAIYTYGFKFDLQGVTSAVVIGNTVTGTWLLYILVRSDWERLSRLVVEVNAESDSSSSRSSDGDSSSSSSSSSQDV